MKYFYCPRCHKKRDFNSGDNKIVLMVCNNPCQETMEVIYGEDN